MVSEDFGMDEILSQDMAAEPGAIVEGIVVGQTDSHLLMNVGLKQEALLPLKEVGPNVPAVGEKIPLLILKMYGPEGRPLVSWRQARERKNWDRIAAAHQKNEIIDGKISQRVKGGVSVDIGLDAFMPASQIDIKPVPRPEDFVGRAVKVLVLEMDRSKGNVLVSRRRVLEQEKVVKRAATLDSIQVGQVLTGKVTGLTNFGAFVDVGGIEGLLHISDISWTRVDNPQTVLKIGEELEVKVLKYDPASHRISLGRKQLLRHPWDGIEERHPVGSIVKGKVTGLADFGAFVAVEPGVEGLIHISELSWTDRVKRPHDVLKVGQDVEARLIGIERKKEKISLSLRRAGPNPWERAKELFPINSHVEGEISHLAPFGAFVRISLGIEGLIKNQDISWTDRAATAKDAFKVGDKVTAVVLEMDAEKEKMSLGLKQMSPDPLRSLKVGQAVTGVVAKVTDFGAFLKLPNGLDGLIRSSEYQHEREAPGLKEGDTVSASVIKVDKKERKLELSIRRYERDQEKALLRKYSGSGAKLTLGETTGWEEETSSSE